MTRIRSIRLLGAALLSAALPVLAHPGHPDPAAGFLAGFAHPWGGADHLLAMVTVGLWGALVLPAGRRVAAPLAFLGAMLAGAVAARTGWLPVAGGALESLVAASVVLLGVMLAAGARLGARPGLVLVALAGALHGAVHAADAAGAPGFAAYAGGFLAASALLHGAGWACGLKLAAWHRLAGSAVGLAGLWLLMVPA